MYYWFIGPIRKFKLFSWHACNEAIRRWMLILSTNEIEHLNLEFYDYDACVIPSCFFSCNALKSVCLAGCSINGPQVFNDFPLLHTLCLYRFNLSGFGIEKLVSSCPLLEHLELISHFQQGCLRIFAPKLTFLAIGCDFHDICLETPKLVEGRIFLYGQTRDYMTFSAAKDGKESNITRALGHLSNIRKLEIRGLFLEYLAMGPIPDNLPTMFNHLSEISVQLGDVLNKSAIALCLFQSAPNLKKLRIECWDFGDPPPYVEGSWGSKAIQDCLFKRLEVVNIVYNQYPGDLDLGKTKSMLEFAKLVLSSAPLLEEFRVTELEDDMVVFKELTLFPKLSKKCTIVLLKGLRGNHEVSDGDEHELCPRVLQ